MEKKTTYPQFRKYPDGRNYFKIISPSEFEELQFIGGKCLIHRFEARILPDRNFIYDLTFGYEEFWVKITGEEYEEMRLKAV